MRRKLLNLCVTSLMLIMMLVMATSALADPTGITGRARGCLEFREHAAIADQVKADFGPCQIEVIPK
jgi:hypothetical protein